MPEKSNVDSNANQDNEYLPISREELERELRAEKGDKWMEEHKTMLDSQWEYIDSL